MLCLSLRPGVALALKGYAAKEYTAVGYAAFRGRFRPRSGASTQVSRGAGRGEGGGGRPGFVVP